MSCNLSDPPLEATAIPLFYGNLVTSFDLRPTILKMLLQAVDDYPIALVNTATKTGLRAAFKEDFSDRQTPRRPAPKGSPLVFEVSIQEIITGGDYRGLAKVPAESRSYSDGIMSKLRSVLAGVRYVTGITEEFQSTALAGTVLPVAIQLVYPTLLDLVSGHQGIGQLAGPAATAAMSALTSLYTEVATMSALFAFLGGMNPSTRVFLTFFLMSTFFSISLQNLHLEQVIADNNAQVLTQLNKLAAAPITFHDTHASAMMTGVAAAWNMITSPVQFLQMNPSLENIVTASRVEGAAPLFAAGARDSLLHDLERAAFE